MHLFPPSSSFFARSTRTLRRLSIDSITLSKLATEVNQLPNLDDLKLLIVRRDKRSSEDVLDEVFETVSDFSALRSLGLACTEYIDFYASDVDRLPLRLDAFRLALWFPDETLQKLLSNKHGRVLRNITVAHSEMREEMAVLARKAGWEVYRGDEGVRFSR